MTQAVEPNAQPQPFQFTFTHPYDSYVEGEQTTVPYLVDGLLTLGGMSILAGKPKQGKSSISRYLAVSIAAGTPFLGREVMQGEVMMLNLEDPQRHLDNCLKALGYDHSVGHREIHIADRLSSSVEDSYAALDDALAKHKDVCLVIIDHLAKLVQVRDIAEYSPVQQQCQKLRDIARKHNVHLMALAHCKKVATEDPFDQFLGTTAMRGETDTNIVVFNRDGEKFITSETRIGRPILGTQLIADVIESDGANVVRRFSLGMSLDEWEIGKREQKETQEEAEYENRIITFLQSCEGKRSLQGIVTNSVPGRMEAKIKAIKNLDSLGLIRAEGRPRELQLIEGEMLQLYLFGRG